MDTAPGLDHHAAARRSWQQADRKPRGEQIAWSHLTRPWVGKHYGAHRIAALGINLNEAGGLDTLRGLVNAAKEELKSGKIDVSFHQPHYHTPYWYAIGLYSSNIVQALHADEPVQPPKTPACVFDWIALLNHVKCSPCGEKSKPSEAMWSRCSSHILARELTELAPRLLLVLGTSNNLWSVNHFVLDSEPELVDVRGYVRAFRGRLTGQGSSPNSIPLTCGPGGPLSPPTWPRSSGNIAAACFPDGASGLSWQRTATNLRG